MDYQLMAYVAAGLIAGIVGGVFLRKLLVEGHAADINTQGKKILETAISEAKQVKKENLLKAKEAAYKQKQLASDEIRKEKQDLKEEVNRLGQKKGALKKEWLAFDKRKEEQDGQFDVVKRQQQAVAEKNKEADLLIGKQRIQLEKISGVSQDEAKKMLMESLESEARMDAAKRLARIENEMKMEADRSQWCVCSCYP